MVESAAARLTSPVRLAVYTDYVYQQHGGRIHAERAFALFVIGLVPFFEAVRVVGRLQPEAETARYELPREMGFTPLPYYESLADPGDVLRASGGSLRRFWRVLDDVDVAWVLGPSPFAVAFSLLTIARRKRLVLGVRQDYPSYLSARHADRPWVRFAGRLLDGAFRALARRTDVVAVGPQIADRYGRPGHTLEISVSLTSERDIVPEHVALERSYEGDLVVLSVGRLEEEKNPLLLADVLARLRERDGGRWRLVVCGEGPLRDRLAARLDELGVAEHAELRGYVPQGEGLLALYRSSHALLHVSWTEGLPQVIGEALAAGLPTVATGVGGIPAAFEGAVRLIPPGDPEAAAAELRSIASDADGRAGLVREGLRWAAAHSFERESGRVRDFLIGGWRRR